MRRVQGNHDLRLDGVSDILHRARNASVFDIGCNRGLAGYEFAGNGASGSWAATSTRTASSPPAHVFCDLRAVKHRFEVCRSHRRAGRCARHSARTPTSHDIVLMLATYHKLRRIMPKPALSDLTRFFGAHTAKYFVWRGYEEEIAALDKDLGASGLIRVQTSMISDIQPAAIWARK
jgi:hypothetical protein